MKLKIITAALFFSLAFNVAALAAYLLHRPAGGCPMERNLSAAIDEKLALGEEQRKRFSELDAAYREGRDRAAHKLRNLRRELLDQVLGDYRQEAVEEILKRISEEQMLLQRALLENLREKVLLLDDRQKDVYRELVEKLAEGCGCVGCGGTCQH